MVTLGELLVPILLATVFVFIASAVVWTVLPFHKKDWAPLPAEDEFMAGLRATGITPGQYLFPYGTDPNDEGVKAKATQGPVGYLYVVPSGPPKMGGKLIMQFLYQLAIVVVIAYVASRTLSAGAEYLTVFRTVGTVAFLGFAGALLPGSIWWGRSWRMTWLEVADAFVYALLVAGVFGWLWPVA